MSEDSGHKIGEEVTCADGRRIRLTVREREVAACLLHGCDDHEIARRIHVEAQTVRNYLHRLYGKLGVNSRAEAIVLLIEGPEALGARR